ncbi:MULTISPECIES: DUF4381 domain-containing protein [Gammaproteobacteria]|uniref:DUF4381 domain-containing protein n=1 Tax=Gammaproteobacteria TaxID=1236 RepID=UPI0014032FAE|nr:MULTISPECIES: DUF4381 domain-containing protein [Gammaproteobacteria]
MNNPLAQLNDIHEISTVTWWPLGWGWWALIALLIIAITVSILVSRKRKRDQWVWRQCCQTLQTPQNSMGDITTVLKLACRRYLSDANNSDAKALHTLTGKAWLVYLNNQLQEPLRASEQHVEALALNMYRQTDAQHVEQYQQFALTWLHHACPRRPNYV